MTAFTLVHTALSLLPVGFGFAAFARHGDLAPTTRLGRLYAVTMFVAAATGFGFLPALGFTPGQVLTLITLALLAVGTLTVRGHWRAAGYTQAVALTTSFLLLMVFLTTETLRRVPAGHPFAAGPTDPSLVPVRLALLVAYVVVLGYQLLKIRAERRTVERLERAITTYLHAA